MSLRHFAIVLPLLLPLAAPAADHDHSNTAPAAAQVPWAQGTVKKIDKATGRATIAHGPIDSIGMGPMTMMFAVKDTAGLAKIKEGDKVRFQAVMAGGDIVVTRIEATK
jgi:Cu(I)/Ag(I) efflux system periplasmic protein CusF